MQFVPAAGISYGGAALAKLCREPQTVAAVFPHAPFDPAAYPARAAEIAAQYRVDRTRLVDALLRYNRAIGSDGASIENIQRLADRRALTVVTGQQAGFLIGPLYTVLKAATALKLAREQEAALGVPVVPVFWAASEDHDYAEIATAYLPLYGDDGMKRISLPEPPAGRYSVGHLPLPPEAPELIEQAIAGLPDTEFKAPVAEKLRSLLQPLPQAPEEAVAGTSIAAYFARLMAWIFAGTGLVIVDPMQPELRALTAPLMAAAIRHQPQVAAALAEGDETWRALGNEPTLEVVPESLGLFIYHQGQRLLLHSDGKRAFLRDEPAVSWDLAELARLAEAAPERFSPSVALRPVMEGYLLPDLAYVGGPGEVAYWGMLQPVFRALDRRMPVVYPRFSGTVVEGFLARNMQKQDLTLADVLFHLDERRKELLEREDRLGLKETFASFQQDFDARYDQLLEVLFQLDPGLKPFTEENRKQIDNQFKKLEEKAYQQHRKNCEVALRQFQRLSEHLHPNGKLQERFYSPFAYMAKYGPDVFARLAQELPLRTDVHYEIQL